MMVGRDVSLEVEKGAPAGEKREALRVENLYYNSVSGKQLLQSVSFSLYRGRILGVAAKALVDHKMAGIMPMVIGII